MASLDQHWAYLTDAVEGSKSAPLSARKAMLAVLLADAFADHLFEASGAQDILQFRHDLAESCREVDLVFILARNEGRLRIVVEAVSVPLEDYQSLNTGDFMVSLYNQHSVQRALILTPDGERLPVHAVLDVAVNRLAQAKGLL